ncbi:MAG TPA: NAD-dependent succinate-semialdehyde dehydrogenase [Opitutaceae bacterium]|nr:NAD-dependent succinate-semialdehyde dehydrogenase [Opitutaceae bacterium]
MSLASINPATGEMIRRYREHTPVQIAAAVERAHAAFPGWRRLAPGQRGRQLCAVAAALRRRLDDHAHLITREMGKPLAQSRAEIEKCAFVCEHFAKNAAAYLADERPPDAPARSFVSYQPLGVILAVMPWNFPYWQVFRAAVPALMAGNTVLLKHASNVCGCALALESVFRDAGLPPGAFQSLLIRADRVPALIGAPRVRAVTLTGSTAAGRQVAALAGAALKKCVLELGGSDPYVILADADVDLAAEVCARSRLVNSGQSCIAAKRFIVVRSVRAAFERRFVERMAARRVGPPADPGIDVGPLARNDLRAELHAQVRASLRGGARLLLGGRPLPGPGWFYPPTVLTDVRPGTPACDDELFGPVAAVIPVRDEAAAIAAANASAYGLGAAVFTRNRRRGRRLAVEELEAGLAFVNDFVRSDPALPFGGVKESGFGRELGSIGIREFTNVKTVMLA